MRIVRWILAVLALLLIAGTFVPADYETSSSIVVGAPPERIHRFVGHLEEWPKWIPWDDMDPTMETTLGEKTTGVGASQSWTGKDGAGELVFTECDPNRGVAYDMFFVDGEKRLPAHCEIRYEPVEGGTRVVWTMRGTFEGIFWRPIDGFMRLVFVPMIEDNFQQGLESLRKVVEEAA